MSDVLLIMGSYFLLVFIVFAFLSFMLSGFMGPYLKVKASRGKKVLVKIKTVTTDYYRAGKIDEGLLTFKDKNRETRTVTIIKDAISRGLNINFIEILDDNSSVILPKTGEVISSYDAVKISNYITRALTRPELSDNKTKIILVLCGVILLAIVILVFMILDVKSLIGGLGVIAGGSVVPVPPV